MPKHLKLINNPHLLLTHSISQRFHWLDAIPIIIFEQYIYICAIHQCSATFYGFVNNNLVLQHSTLTCRYCILASITQHGKSANVQASKPGFKKQLVATSTWVSQPFLDRISYLMKQIFHTMFLYHFFLAVSESNPACTSTTLSSALQHPSEKN